MRRDDREVVPQGRYGLDEQAPLAAAGVPWPPVSCLEVGGSACQQADGGPDAVVPVRLAAEFEQVFQRPGDRADVGDHGVGVRSAERPVPEGEQDRDEVGSRHPERLLRCLVDSAGRPDRCALAGPTACGALFRAWRPSGCGFAGHLVASAGVLACLRVEAVDAALACGCRREGFRRGIDGLDLVHAGDLDCRRLYLVVHGFASRCCLKVRLGGGEEFHPGHPVDRCLPAG